MIRFQKKKAKNRTLFFRLKRKRNGEISARKHSKKRSLHFGRDDRISYRVHEQTSHSVFQWVDFRETMIRFQKKKAKNRTLSFRL